MKYQFIILSLLSLTLAQATATKLKNTMKALDAKSKIQVKNLARSTLIDPKEATSTGGEKEIGPHNPRINIPINLNIRIPYWVIKLLPANIQAKVKALVPKKSDANEVKGEQKSDKANLTPTKEGDTKNESEKSNKLLAAAPTPIADPTKTKEIRI